MFKGLSQMGNELKRVNMDMLKLNDGQAVVVRILVSSEEIMAVYEHTEQIGQDWKTITCLDRNFNKRGDCPLCAAGKNASFKAYIPVIDRTDDNKVKVFKASKDVLKFIAGLVEEYGELVNRDIKIVRSGKGLQTTYQIFPKDPKKEDLSSYELPNIEDRIKPLTREAIINILNGGTAQVSEVKESDTEGQDSDYPF